MGAATWGYRKIKGEVEAKLFDDGLPSKGWQDSPAKLTTKKPSEKSDDDGK
jgi:hypothetical protein